MSKNKQKLSKHLREQLELILISAQDIEHRGKNLTPGNVIHHVRGISQGGSNIVAIVEDLLK